MLLMSTCDCQRGGKLLSLWAGYPWVPSMEAILEESRELHLQATEPVADWMLIPGRRLYVALENRIQPPGLPQSCGTVLRVPLVLERCRVPELLQSCEAFLTDDPRCRANFTLKQFELAVVPPVFLLQLTGGLAQLLARLECACSAKVFPIGLVKKTGGALDAGCKVFVSLHCAGFGC